MSGLDYFFKGFELIRVKGVKRFVLIPLMVNVILFSVAFGYLFTELELAIAAVIDWIPDWDWLSGIKDNLHFFLWPLALVIILLVFSYIFNTVANWLAAPFNGLLAEKIELYLTGQPLGNGGIMDVVKDVPRTLSREWTKLWYYIPRAIGFLLLFFLLPAIGQVLWFLFTAWMMAIQYCDYPFDNHKTPFGEMRQSLSRDKTRAFSFGIAVTCFAMLPIINFLVMPVAICGATAMYVDRHRAQEEVDMGQ